MKKLLTLLLAAAMLLALCACGYDSGTVVAAVPVTARPAADPTQEPSPDPTGSPATVTLYTGDSSTGHIQPVQCELDEVTAQAIADKLTELGVFTGSVTVNSCNVGSINVLQLDMGRDFARQFSGVNSAAEHIMVGCLVNSFLTAYGADGLTLTVDGSALDTGRSVYNQTMILFTE